MTGEEARQHLEAVDRGLAAAIKRLVATPSRTGQLPVELEQLAQTINRVYDDHASCGRADSLVSSLRSIQERVARVQLLLDAAVTFYCGAISTSLSHGGFYTVDGGTPRAGEQGYFRVEA